MRETTHRCFEVLCRTLPSNIAFLALHKVVCVCVGRTRDRVTEPNAFHHGYGLCVKTWTRLLIGYAINLTPVLRQEIYHICFAMDLWRGFGHNDHVMFINDNSITQYSNIINMLTVSVWVLCHVRLPLDIKGKRVALSDILGDNSVFHYDTPIGGTGEAKTTCLTHSWS